MVVELRNITIENEKDLAFFLSTAGSSLNSFRYFSTRDFSVLKNHLSTVLLYEYEQAIGYGHLDKDAEIVWLGICLSEEKKGKGYGKLIMNRLIEEAQLNDVPVIKLSVDASNLEAIQIYNKYGFRHSKEIKPGVMLMELELKK